MKRHAAMLGTGFLLFTSAARADSPRQGGSPPPVVAPPPVAPPPMAPPPPVTQPNYVPPPPVGQPNYAPPPPVGQPNYVPPPGVVRPGMVSQPPTAPPPAQEPLRRNRTMFFTGLNAGAGIPVGGDLGDFASVGGGGVLSGGLYLPSGLSGRLEIGYRTNPAIDLDGEDVSALYYGAVIRYALMPQSAARPYLEVGFDLYSSLVAVSTDTSSGASTSGGGGFSTAFGAGLQYDLSEQLSVEAGLRFDYLLSNTAGTLSGGLLNVFLGGAYYY